jgi:hypothetical protein
MKRISKKKFFFGFVVVLLLVITVFFGFMINSLPSLHKIKSKLKADKKQTSMVTETRNDKTSVVKNESQPSPSQNEQEADLGEVVQEDQEEKKEQVKETLITFMNEDFDDVRVCENLGKTEYFEWKKSGKDFSFDQMMKDTERDDPFLEALRTPLKAVFQDKNVKPLLQEVFDLEAQNLTEEEKDSFFEKVGFYSRVANAGVNLLRRRSYFESIADQAMHLGVLAKMAKLKPEILADTELTDLCQEMEEVMVGEDEIDVVSERAKIKILIAKYGFKNEELDFDPDSYIKFKVNFSDKGLNFSLNDKP